MAGGEQLAGLVARDLGGTLHVTVEERLQTGQRLHADETVDHAPVTENAHVRDVANAELAGDAGLRVRVDARHGEPAAVVSHELLQQRRESPARRAPRCPEIHGDGGASGAFDDVVRESLGAGIEHIRARRVIGNHVRKYTGSGRVAGLGSAGEHNGPVVSFRECVDDLAEMQHVPRPTTPALAVDVVIEMVDRPGRPIVFIERRHEPLGWALPGGFVDVGETLESAAVREAREETGLDVALGPLLGCYSDPARDPRGHTVSVVYIGEARGEPQAADDARAVAIVDPASPPPLAFDHARIVVDYLSWRAGSLRKPGS